ncbi:MAG: glycosyltransferase family 4 protein [bacterium]
MNLNVCMVISYFYPFVGGAEGQALKLAQELKKKGIDIFIVTRRVRGLSKFESFKGIDLYRLWGLGKDNRISSLFFSINLLFFLIKKRSQYQIIHCHLLSTLTVICILIGKLLNKKVIAKLGGSGRYGDLWAIKNKALLGRAKLWVLINYIDLFICPSREIRQELLNTGTSQDKVMMIPNGVSINNFFPLDLFLKQELKQKMGMKGQLIIFSGRLSPEKDLETLLSVFKEIVKDYEIALLILGAGPLESKYQDWVGQNQLKEKVYFLGNIEKVTPYLQISDIFVLPSLSEGLSNSLLEAMACGIPAVVTDIGGNRDMIHDGINGFLFVPQNKARLKEKLVFLLENPTEKERLRKEARKTIEERYTLELVAKRYIDCYKALLGG